MASVTDSPPPSAAHAEERMVDEQIRRTLRSLKLLDLAAGIITLVIGVLAYLLTAAVLDQWVIPGGWSSTARLLLLALMVVGMGWYSWRAFWPLMSQSINPAYAAQLIERNSPSLKNSLLNFLLLRTQRRLLSQKVYQAIEQQAAQRLSEVSMDTVVDRSALLRLGYVLVAVVALCALYRVLSPKNLTTSMSRVLMPWSEIAVPSRVEILDITPGETSLARGEALAISAEVHGLNENEPVEVHYSTLDGQAVDRVVAMSGSAGGLRYEGEIPDRFTSGENGGVQQDLDYWIMAGDAQSPKYRVTVFARPTLVVERIRYEFPAYTGLASREVEGTGDIHAMEGTKVTLYAQANHEIASASVDFSADGRHELPMKSDGDKANVEFTLELEEDRRTPKYESYVLRYKTASGRTNTLPPKYEIDVTPDYAPEIQFLAPRDEEGQPVERLDVSVNQQFTIEVEARDPDFLLSKVSLLGQLAGKQMLDHELLSGEHEGRFVGQFTATPEELDLKPGDILEYWVTASDNRRPQANFVETEKLKMRVIGPPQFDQQNQNGEGEQPNQGGGEGEQGEGGESGDQQGEASGAGGESSGEEGEQDQSQEGGGEGAQGEGGEGEQQLGGEGEGGENQKQEGDSGNQQENQDGTGGENSEPSGQQQPGKVSAEGDNDPEAFERISDHFAEKDANSQEQQGGASEDASGEQGDADSQTGAERSEGTADSEQTGEESDAQQGEAGTEGAEQDRKSQGAGAEGEPAGEEPSQQNELTQESDEEKEAPTGELSGEQGDPGAGENPGEEQGSPEALEKKPGEKSGEDSQDPQENDQGAPGQGRGEKESDSQGGQSGDRSGGGQEGGGQQADAEGTGAAGENQAADEGAGQATEPGAGEDSARPGTDGASDKPTGESSEDQPGEWSKESTDGSGSQPGGEEGQTAAGEEQSESGGENASGEGKPDTSDNANPSNTVGQQPPGGGTGGTSSPPPPGELMPGDEANLEYARKQSSLVLNRLEDQLDKDQVDQEMLEKLGWSKQELQQFVDRWNGLMNAADQEGPAGGDAQQELNEALRSLGLRPGQRGFESQAIQEKLRELKDSYRGQTPLEYADRVRAYIKGTATAGEKEE